MERSEMRERRPRISSLAKTGRKRPYAGYERSVARMERSVIRVSSTRISCGLRSSGREKPRPLAVEHHAGQAAGQDRAGIDVDPVRQAFRGLDWRMAMHNDLPEIHRTEQEFLADPHEVVGLLAVERYAWPHAGVAHEVRPNAGRELEREQKSLVRLRHGGRERARRFKIALVVLKVLDRHTVGLHRLEPAVAPPERADQRIAQEFQQKVLVVAFERDVVRRERIAR